MQPKAADVVRALKQLADPERATFSRRFFKAGPGEYAEGDRFLGVTVPAQRKVAKAHATLALAELDRLLASPIHEHRLTALFVVIRQYERGDDATRERLYRWLVERRGRINNWDLVDTIAPKLIGVHLRDHPRERKRLRGWAASASLWDRRIAVLCTYAFIRAGELGATLRLAKELLRDEHDLIHKAVGWMLREVGNRDADLLAEFLQSHAASMPRTMLRYAIERLPAAERKRYMAMSPTRRKTSRRPTPPGVHLAHDHGSRHRGSPE